MASPSLPDPAPAAPAQAGSPAGRALFAIVAVAALGWLVVTFLWTPLGWPAVFLNGVAAQVGPTSCAELDPATSEGQNCATMVGLMRLVGPLLIGLVMLVLRKRISGAMQKLGKLLPEPVRIVVAPMTAIVLFTMGWAGIHDATRASAGLPGVTHQTFPVVVGLLTLATMLFGPRLHASAPGLFRARDRMPQWFRLGILIAAAAGVSYLVMHNTAGAETYLVDPGLKEQGVVLFSIVLGWLLLAPARAAASSPGPGARPPGPAAPPPGPAAPGPGQTAKSWEVLE